MGLRHPVGAIGTAIHRVSVHLQPPPVWGLLKAGGAVDPAALPQSVHLPICPAHKPGMYQVFLDTITDSAGVSDAFVHGFTWDLSNSYASSLGHTLYFAVAGTNAMGEWVGWDRSSRGEGGGG